MERVVDAYGHRWYRRKDGYYSNSRLGLLHRYVYAAEVGPIPDGAHVHHRDEDKANNDPSNLVALTPADHFAEHPRDAEWHRAGGRAAWRDRPIVAKVCEQCRATFDTRNAQARFCSPVCGQRYYARTQTGRAHEERVCGVCGAAFTTRRSGDTRTCSRPCTAVLAYRNRRPSL